MAESHWCLHGTFKEVVYMYIYICMWISYIHMHMYIYWIHLPIYVYIHIHKHIIYMYAYLYIYIYQETACTARVCFSDGFLQGMALHVAGKEPTLHVVAQTCR